MNKGTAIVGFFMSFLAGMFLMWGIDRSGGVNIAAEHGGTASAVDHSQAAIPVGKDDPTWGNPEAPVTIVEISDFECPFCSRVTPTMKQVKETYGPDKVRVVWKNMPLPFHKDARPAADAAATVQGLGGDFWKFHDQAFANQKDLNEENFKKWAVAAGVDGAKFEEAFKSKKFSAKVDQDMALARKIGANGTPAFRINGVELSGAQPFPKFKELIDAQLAEAQKLVAAGTKPAEVYPKLVAQNAKVGPDQPAAQKAQEEPPPDTTVWKVPVLSDDPVRGGKEALVTVVIFSDFQCPFCKRVEPTLKQLADTYKDDIRFVWKDNPLPFHPRALPAADLARVAYVTQGNDGFWKAHDALFESQPKLEDADLQAIATKLNIQWSAVENAIKTEKFKDKFEADMDLGMDLQARGTPHFFINGMRLAGAQPFDKFKEVVDAQMVKAKAVVAKGTPRAKVYDEIMKEGKEPPPPPKKEIGPAPADSPVKGNKNAKIVIQEFSDFECPFCSRVEPTMTQVMEEYGNDVKVIWRNMPLPFHKDAPLAAEAAYEVYKQKGDKAFWDYHDKLFASQKAPGGIERENLEKFAAELGVDMAKFKKALDERTHKARIEADAKAGNDAGVSGTPAFVVNGYFISGAQPYPAFKKVIKRAKSEL